MVLADIDQVNADWSDRFSKFKSKRKHFAFNEWASEVSEVATKGVLKKVFLEISQNSQENTCVRDSFLIKFIKNFKKKESLAQVFSCEICEVSKNIFFYRTPLVAASVIDINGFLFTFRTRIMTKKS